MSEQTRLQSDLMCAFGFNKANAVRALALWLNGELQPDESAALNHIQIKNPFQMQNVPPHRLEPLKFPNEYIDVLNKLNLRISNGS